MSQLDLFTDESFTSDTPFTDRVVCVLGAFSMASKHLMQRLQDMGADIKSSLKVSRNVHYVLVGRGAPQDQLDTLRMLAFHGYCPRVLYQHDLDLIFQGYYSDYRVPLEIGKSLKLTYQHYLQSHVQMDGVHNPLYTSEVYVAPDTLTPSQELYQQLGDRGVYANPYIDDTTAVILLSDNTLHLLQQGQTNDVIRTIEDAYNKSRSQTFRYQFVSETDVLNWLS